MRIIINENHFEYIKESLGDLTIQGKAEQNNISSYQNLLRNNETQAEIQKADAIGDNVNVKIIGNNSNGITLSVDGQKGLDDANDATKQAISNGASVMVNNANKFESRYSKKTIEEMKIKYRKQAHS